MLGAKQENGVFVKCLILIVHFRELKRKSKEQLPFHKGKADQALLKVCSVNEQPVFSAGNGSSGR